MQGRMGSSGAQDAGARGCSGCGGRKRAVVPGRSGAGAQRRLQREVEKLEEVRLDDRAGARRVGAREAQVLPRRIKLRGAAGRLAAEDGGILERRLREHHRIAPRGGKAALNVLGPLDPAVCDDGDGECRLDGADRLPRALDTAFLLARAPCTQATRRGGFVRGSGWWVGQGFRSGGLRLKVGFGVGGEAGASSPCRVITEAPAACSRTASATVCSSDGSSRILTSTWYKRWGRMRMRVGGRGEHAGQGEGVGRG